MGEVTNVKPVIFNSIPSLPAETLIVDGFTVAIEELFFLDNPGLKKGMNDAEILLKQYKANNKVEPIWIYYPWKNICVMTVSEKYYYRLRTARNRNIITQEEQEKYRNFTVGIAGLSIGSAILSALVYTGGPKHIRIADFDTIEITNLNRMVANLTEVGQNKAIVAARRVYELDPFANIDVFDSGVDEQSIESFIDSEQKLDLFIDAMDSLPLKVKARFYCRKKRIPVLMVTSNGDSNILDVERFDIDPKLNIFNGRLGNVTEDDFKYVNYSEWLALAVKIVGFEDLTPGMRSSLMQIGKSIPSVPQLATTVNIGAASIAYTIRKIANNINIESGRYIVSLESTI